MRDFLRGWTRQSAADEDQKIEEQEKLSREAENRWRKACNEALEAYVPSGAAFKIVQLNSGPYVIQRRRIRISSDFSPSWHPSFYPPASYWDAKSTKVLEYYETVKDLNVPVSTQSPYDSWRSPSTRITDYVDLMFNVFADAEAYLKRMTRSSPATAEYDFPPLKKRAAATERSK